VIPPINQEDERKVVFALIKDINRFYGMGIDPRPCLERMSVTQGTDMEKSRTVLLGASHMTRLTEEMGQEMINFASKVSDPRNT
jgi:hypothetical protein